MSFRKITVKSGNEESTLEVTEEEYLDAVSKQDQKQNAEWHEFTDENINTLF